MSPDEIVEALNAMTPEQRMEVLTSIDWCKHCGSNNPRCQCWNDE